MKRVEGSCQTLFFRLTVRCRILAPFIWTEAIVLGHLGSDSSQVAKLVPTWHTFRSMKPSSSGR